MSIGLHCPILGWKDTHLGVLFTNVRLLGLSEWGVDDSTLLPRCPPEASGTGNVLDMHSPSMALSFRAPGSMRVFGASMNLVNISPLALVLKIG